MHDLRAAAGAAPPADRRPRSRRRRRRSSAIPPSCTTSLRNLIENAANYAPERTTISLSALRDGDHVALVVEDEGPGIPEADLQRVFERFYRVDKARSRETGGTGLGLSIVKHLVGLHGGDVRVENRAGGGARFTVRIPA